MDLSFARFDRGTAITVLPTDLAVLLAAVTGRQAASQTARLQTRLAWKRAPVSLLHPADGAFDGWTAALLASSVAPWDPPVAPRQARDCE
ncbi:MULTISPECIES: hypothetical protein [unclassified Sphingomonas]|uniref:hypothetical protein n=1 Tax=unclassified Sphingomonas TaxID=196159 RepID=UPI0009E696EE|nr:MULTISPECIES: hypothetical protein [unclassified Sphingomonas]